MCVICSCALIRSGLGEPGRTNTSNQISSLGVAPSATGIVKMEAAPEEGPLHRVWVLLVREAAREVEGMGKEDPGVCSFGLPPLPRRRRRYSGTHSKGNACVSL